MRFMILFKATPESEAGKLPSEEARAAMDQFSLKMIEAGMVLGGGGLQPSSKGSRISFSGGKKVVTDGPFTETKELVGGFAMIQAESKEEAVAWLSRAPVQDGEIEIRQVFDPSDLPPEVANKERRAKLDALIDRANAQLNAS